jgi:hypothetical protein
LLAQDAAKVLLADRATVPSESLTATSSIIKARAV